MTFEIVVPEFVRYEPMVNVVLPPENATISLSGFSLKLVTGGNVEALGDMKIRTVGKGLYVKTGTNATMGTGTLASGTATINTTKITASSKVFITDAGGGVLANIGSLSVGTVTAGTSFVVNSSNALDSSNFNWIIIEPA